EAEWDRCRWIWNECVAKSRQAHAQSRAGGEKLTCGPAQLDRMLTDARGVTPWLAEGASVPQQQVIRDFARSRAKALKDIKDRLAQHRRAGMPRFKRKRDSRPSLNYTMARKAADAAIAATKRALIEMGRKHARDVRLVHPAHTTMDCATCGARTKHALPLSMRTYACTVCGAMSPRDKNSARVMLVRAGWNPDGAEGVRPPGPLDQEAA
ncbi:zinc ribbon domain-containing protein, partial [Streptomyces sp. NPDC005708]|uniref:zinc ribbon domain-containing protein n=1 Tax=Streptomyces sp. NPDC005708 TaxID=3154564 RepID=UPI0033E763D7